MNCTILIGLEIRMMNQKNLNSVGNALLMPTYVCFTMKSEIGQVDVGWAKTPKRSAQQESA